MAHVQANAPFLELFFVVKGEAYPRKVRRTCCGSFKDTGLSRALAGLAKEGLVSSGCDLSIAVDSCLLGS